MLEFINNIITKHRFKSACKKADLLGVKGKTFHVVKTGNKFIVTTWPDFKRHFNRNAYKLNHAQVNYMSFLKEFSLYKSTINLRSWKKK